MHNVDPPRAYSGQQGSYRYFSFPHRSFGAMQLIDWLQEAGLDMFIEVLVREHHFMEVSCTLLADLYLGCVLRE